MSRQRRDQGYVLAFRSLCFGKIILCQFSDLALQLHTKGMVLGQVGLCTEYMKSKLGSKRPVM